MGPPEGRLGDALLAFALALGLYLSTLAPGGVWGDSADLCVRVYRGSLHFGTASDHPLFVLFGMAMTWLPGSLAHDVNVLSALCAATGVGCVQWLAASLTESRWAGFCAAA